MVLARTSGRCGVIGAKSATADSCFGLIGPRQCSAALGGPATSTEDLRHQGPLSKPGVLKHLDHVHVASTRCACARNATP